MKSGNLNFLEPSGPLQACNGTALPFTYGNVAPTVTRGKEPKKVKKNSLFTSQIAKSTYFSPFRHETNLFFNNTFLLIPFLPVAQQANSGLGRLTLQASVSQTHTHTLGRTSLNRWSTHRRGRYLCNTQQTSIHVISGIRTRNPSNQVTADPHLRRHNYRYRLLTPITAKKFSIIQAFERLNQTAAKQEIAQHTWLVSINQHSCDYLAT